MSSKLKDVGSSTTIHTIGLKQLLNLGPDCLLKTFVKCQVSPHMVYSFKGCALAELLHYATTRDVITALVNAEAYPGPDGDLVTSDHTALAWLPRLQLLAREGLVREHPSHHWRISDAGASKLHFSRAIAGSECVLLPRRDVPLADRTTWELLMLLAAEQWQCLPAPRRKSLPAIKLGVDIPIDERRFYFNRAKLDISADYLRCLLDWKMIRDRGIFFVC